MSDRPPLPRAARPPGGRRRPVPPPRPRPRRAPRAPRSPGGLRTPRRSPAASVRSDSRSPLAPHARRLEPLDRLAAVLERGHHRPADEALAAGAEPGAGKRRQAETEQPLDERHVVGAAARFPTRTRAPGRAQPQVKGRLARLGREARAAEIFLEQRALRRVAGALLGRVHVVPPRRNRSALDELGRRHPDVGAQPAERGDQARGAGHEPRAGAGHRRARAERVGSDGVLPAPGRPTTANASRNTPSLVPLTGSTSVSGSRTTPKRRRAQPAHAARSSGLPATAG